jgi:hypothetical protein
MARLARLRKPEFVSSRLAASQGSWISRDPHLATPHNLAVPSFSDTVDVALGQAGKSDQVARLRPDATHTSRDAGVIASRRIHLTWYVEIHQEASHHVISIADPRPH